MVKYNTALPKLEMREYGRNIQNLIEYCKNLEDRESRNKCAHAIAEIMLRSFPELNGNDETHRKVWEHMNMIADFNLDIDYPCEILGEKDIRQKPSKIAYSVRSDKFRVYGRNLVRMIQEISNMEGGADKDVLIFLVANQMKKLLVSENSDSATDTRVFNDIREITKGRIDIDPENYRLNEYIGVAMPQEGKKKKKKQ